MRTIQRTYQDPLDAIWLATAARLGMAVSRSSEVFASWDGEGTLTIGTPETLDPDDSLAQMILHEVCHALVEGPQAFALEDWGLRRRKPSHEHACLRLQAALADRHGLRAFFASTTDFRPYYDELGPDPLSGDGDPAIPLANLAWNRWIQGPWARPVDDALQATAAIHRVVRPFASDDSIWS